MPFQSTLKLDSAFFSSSERQKAFADIARQAANAFRASLKQKMIESTPSGKISTTARGKTFRTRFQRSKRGQRPAIQTRYLLNSIYARRTGTYSAATLVTAEYAVILQDHLGRKIMTANDIKEAEKDFIERGKKAILSLL